MEYRRWVIARGWPSPAVRADVTRIGRHEKAVARLLSLSPAVDCPRVQSRSPTMEQPAPSPAPTLDDHFPGFYPPTPSVDEPAVDPTPAVSADHAALEHEAEANKHRLEGAGVALLGAAAGFVVGGPLGAAVGGGLAGLSAVEHQGITEMALADEPKHHSSTTTSTTAAAPAAVQLDTHEAFGTPAVEKEQAELAHSPAQQLLNNDNDDGHHLGEALFAGAAGAKLASNEVEEPSTTAGTKQAAVPPVSRTPLALFQRPSEQPTWGIDTAFGR